MNQIQKKLVFGKSSKIMTSRVFQVIAKLLCNLLDISTSHEVYKYSKAVVRLGDQEIKDLEGKDQQKSQELEAR